LAEALGANKNYVQKIKLAKNNITDAGFEKLLHVLLADEPPSDVSTLNLSQNHLTDKSLEILTRCCNSPKNLKTINL
jgi:Ran GTPase-activating protein (RanGAP) involved in mRNA processing and transport